MAGKEIPFDEDMMTLFMGIGDPEEPGQHGRTSVPVPTEDAISVITQIRDLCEDFLKSTGKDEDTKEESEEDTEDMETDMEEE